MWNTKTEPPAASRKREASPELVEEKPGPSARRGTLGKEVEIEAEDHDGRRKKARKLASKVAMPGGKFACPYYKRNPRKYRNWTSCPGPGWEEVHRVKTHLYRRHTLPTQCPRCWDTFKTDTLLQAHIQQDPPCVVKENKLPHEGFTKDQEKRLRSRKKTQADMTDEDKWREIYLILFPDDHPDSVPTPYYDAPEDEETDTPASGTGSGSELEDYASFVRREMPTLVRRELEALFQNELADVEERLKPKVEQIVLGLQPRLMSLYKQSQMPLSDYGPEQQSQQPLTPASPGQLQGYSDKSCAYSPSVQQQQMRRSSGLGSAHSTPAMSTASGGSRSGTIIGSESTPEQELEKAFELDGFPTPPPTGYMNTPHLGVGQWDTMGMHMGMGVQGGQLPVQPAGPQGLGLNWDVEFDRMLDPMAFMPQPGQLGGGYQYQ
ncbi:hypothetical protein QBC35DRAFT_392137 [Podospora australis]|uniref:C2H2-type domain-containing protein n=1 Tax=Podospora australis TaxID=1536484 RepID=A0AAN6WLR1_9PEZI|nr:hypothetical protein QBC35DRAFT_392137 [Podospora australis]